MDACEGHAACHVVFAHSYLSGPICINSSGVTLDIQGTLSMLPKTSYPQPFRQPFITNSNPGTGSGCRVVHNITVCLSNVAITGGGLIQGSSSLPEALEWWACKLTGCDRPHLIGLGGIDGLRIYNINLKNPANHFIETSDSVNVRLDGITATAPNDSPNSDGVNFYGGWDQSLTNSVIHNGDDCVSVVPTGDFFSQQCIMHPETCRGGNVVVRNVTCNGGHGVSIGGIRHGTVNNVTFANLTATGYFGTTEGQYSTGGMRMKSYPNGTGSVYDIRYEDIVLHGVYLPLQILARYCPGAKTCIPDTTAVSFHNISFKNIRGTGRDGKIQARQIPAAAPCAPVLPLSQSKNPYLG